MASVRGWVFDKDGKAYVSRASLEFPIRCHPNEPYTNPHHNTFVRGNVVIQQHDVNVPHCCGWDLERDEAYGYDYNAPSDEQGFPIISYTGGITVAWKDSWVPEREALLAKLARTQ